MDKNLYSVLVKAAYEAYARFDAEARAKASAAAKASAEAAASKEALTAAMQNGAANWFEVDPRAKMYLLLVLPLRIARKGGLSDYGVRKHYISESLRHFGASNRDRKLLLTKRYVNKVWELSKRVPVLARREDPDYVWIMSEAPLMDLIKKAPK